MPDMAMASVIPFPRRGVQRLTCGKAPVVSHVWLPKTPNGEVRVGDRCECGGSVWDRVDERLLANDE